MHIRYFPAVYSAVCWNMMKVRIHDRGEIRQNTRSKECSICVCVAAVAVAFVDVKSELIMKNRHDKSISVVFHKTHKCGPLHLPFAVCIPLLTHRPRNATEAHIKCFGFLVLLWFCRVSHSSINHFHSLALSLNLWRPANANEYNARLCCSGTNTTGI